ncbi:MAG: tRNA lysidine(34) synthetase TilS [Muribaculaceae bacterium]|nr:tRNA lysidine(34) synthetase TilS [Muribaculaceae bacterium]
MHTDDNHTGHNHTDDINDPGTHQIAPPESATDSAPCAGAALLQRESRRLRHLLRRHGIESVLLGLSGGPDSVAAFHLLRLATEGWPEFRLGVTHVNFRLRGEESMRDEQSVRRMLERYPGTEAHFTAFDTERYCRQHALSVEMGARQLRHEWFDTLRARHGYSRIATGHNADDNEETLLLNLLRGSGTRGLRGMTPLTDRVLRPLLHLSRREILSLLDAIAYPGDPRELYVTDSTNLTDDYRRNFLRHRIIPALESRWSGAHTAMQTTLRLMDEECRVVEYAVAKALESAGTLLDWERLREFPSPLTLIRHWIMPHGGTPAQAAEMAALAEHADGGRPQAGARWRLPEAEITATSAGLRLSPLHTIPQEAPQTEWEELTADTEAGRESIMQMARGCRADEAYFPSSPGNYIWRHPRPGERMRIGGGATKLVTHILKEHRVTAALRQHIWLLARRDDDIAVWIPGIRRAATDLLDGTEACVWHCRRKLPGNSGD